jgi:PBP1b-binding outer membrane lipoprotein LpoB
MKKIFLLVSLALLLFGCNRDENHCDSSVKFKVNNQASSVAMIEISPSPNVKLTIPKIVSHSNIDTAVCFDNVPKQDGNYSIHVKHAGLDTTISYGYYSNGIPSPGYIQIIVLDHDVKFEEVI